MFASVSWSPVSGIRDRFAMLSFCGKYEPEVGGRLAFFSALLLKRAASPRPLSSLREVGAERFWDPRKRKSIGSCLWSSEITRESFGILRRSVSALWPRANEASRGDIGPDGGGEMVSLPPWFSIFRSPVRGGVCQARCFNLCDEDGVGGLGADLLRFDSA